MYKIFVLHIYIYTSKATHISHYNNNTRTYEMNVRHPVAV